jgi:hypothetical protein
MRKILSSLALIVACAAMSAGQQNSAAQTARQALLEMFFSKTPGTLAKHLPEATRAALEKSGAMVTLQQYSLMASQFQTQGQNLKTFETGSLLLSGEDPKTGQKLKLQWRTTLSAEIRTILSFHFKRTETGRRNARRSCRGLRFR